MRGSVVGLGLAALVGPGCSGVCGTPDELNGRTFDVFATARQFTLVGEESAFPAESTPANGPMTIGFDWESNLPRGPLSITLDGQVFEDGSGQWSEVNCGNFTTTWGGTYLAEDGSEHTFVASGYFVQYDTKLEGFVDWNEAWAVAGGPSGTFEGEVLLRGEEVR